MSKGLKSLKEIFDAVEAVDENTNCHFNMEEIGCLFSDVEKELKALEIIKKAYQHLNLIEMWATSLINLKAITKEEYDLLKEALNNNGQG